MSSIGRQYSLLDKIISQIDAGLQTVAASAKSSRPNPSLAIEEVVLSSEEKKRSAGLMRVNHTGEVCAQALYRGQLLVAHDVAVKKFLSNAAMEETDHLAWCQERLRELNSHTSYLNIVWYSLSFTLGVVAGFVGDALSLGFVEETEQQVSRHLQEHLQQIASEDHKSRAVVQQMYVDELEHATGAQRHGASPLPLVIQVAMQCMAKVMKVVAYRV